MMETQKFPEMLVFDPNLMQLIAQEDFSASSSFCF
jgi:hypothetical protein